MNSRTFLAIFAVVCFIALASAQSADPIASLQDKASAVASSATNTAAPSPTGGESAGNMLTSGSIFMQLVVLACAFVASSFLV